MEPQPVALGQEPHHRERGPSAASHGRDTCGVPRLAEKADYVERGFVHDDDRATSTRVEVKREWRSEGNGGSVELHAS